MKLRHWAVALALLVGTGCSQQEGVGPEPAPLVCPPFEGGTPVAPELLAFLSTARSAHHSADLHESNEDVAKAIEVLRTLLDRAKRHDSAPEVREVLADTHARVADLESRRKQFAAADQSIEAGLGYAKETTYFRGHLFEVRGLVEERRAKAARADGDEAGAKEATERALAAFEQSMKIQEKVIDTVLPEGDPK